LIGDKVYFSRANRQALRARRIPHTTPERDDQKANRVRYWQRILPAHRAGGRRCRGLGHEATSGYV
jgi:hypothetical protein